MFSRESMFYQEQEANTILGGVTMGRLLSVVFRALENREQYLDISMAVFGQKSQPTILRRTTFIQTICQAGTNQSILHTTIQGVVDMKLDL